DAVGGQLGEGGGLAAPDLGGGPLVARGGPGTEQFVERFRRPCHRSGQYAGSREPPPTEQSNSFFYVESALSAVITGASSGIGEATARRLAREQGAELVLVARREERLRALAEELPCRATYVAADLTEAGAPERIREHVAEELGRLTLLVNNAGNS